MPITTANRRQFIKHTAQLALATQALALSTPLAAKVLPAMPHNNTANNAHSHTPIDALALAAQIKNRQTTPAQLLEQTFAKIQQHNPAINAVTSTRLDKALAEAASRNFDGLPFGGVPILIKGLGQDLAGEPNTAGAKLLAQSVAKRTSAFVSTLERAGFIVLGQTNTPEFGFKNITDPQLYGPTRNPWNLQHSAGGSSGGAAAVIAAGISPVAAASDGGGSIRIPASFSGLIGLKPTRGKTPVGPGVGRNWQGAAINFALTRTMRDTAAMLDALQIEQPAAAFLTPVYEPGYLRNLSTFKNRKFKIAYSLKSPVNTPVSDEAIAAVMQAVAFLKECGHQVVEQNNGIDGIALMKSYYAMNAGETAAMFQKMESAFGRPLLREDMELITWALWQTGKKLSAADYSISLAAWDVAAEQMANFNQQFDLYLTPATAHTAPLISAQLQTDESIAQMETITALDNPRQLQVIWDMFEPSLALTPFTQQANLTGQPAISLPTHIAANGLPLGIHFTAPKGREEWLLGIGLQFEESGRFKSRTAA